MNFVITGDNTYDCTQVENLIHSVIHEGVRVLADRAYDVDKIIEYIKSKLGIAVIPSRKNCKTLREYDKEVYKNRNQI